MSSLNTKLSLIYRRLTLIHWKIKLRVMLVWEKNNKGLAFRHLSPSSHYLWVCPVTVIPSSGAASKWRAKQMRNLSPVFCLCSNLHIKSKRWKWKPMNWINQPKHVPCKSNQMRITWIKSTPHESFSNHFIELHVLSIVLLCCLHHLNPISLNLTRFKDDKKHPQLKSS